VAKLDVVIVGTDTRGLALCSVKPSLTKSEGLPMLNRSGMTTSAALHPLS
jgi:hypothetical protein